MTEIRAQSCRAILSPWMKFLLFISAIFESSQSALYGAHAVAVAFFSEQVLGIERLSDRAFDDLLERKTIADVWMHLPSAKRFLRSLVTITTMRCVPG
jgi:hypothetical protein